MLTRRPRLLARLFPLAAILAIVATSGLAKAQDDDDEPEDAAQPQQEQRLGMGVWTDENFDQWVYGGRGAPGVRTRFDSLLALQIEDADRSCGLTEAQKKKLQLAGRGDVKHFFDRVAVKKQKFQLVKNDQNKINEVFQDIQPLQVILQSGPFDEESIFAKTIKNTLDPEQAAKYEKLQRERRLFRYRAKVELVVGMIDNAVGLRGDQRDRLIKLLLEETQPPKKYGQYDYYVVMLQLSRLPEEKVKAILDGAQWRSLSRQFNQVKGMEPFLKTNGIFGD